MVSDVITAPQRHIAADAGERLDGVVLENKAVLLQFEAGKHGRPAAQVRHQAIALCARGEDLLGANRIEAGVADGNEETEAVRREDVRDAFEGYDRAVVKARLGQVLFIDREGGHVEIGIMPEKEIGDLGVLPGTEDHDLHRMPPM
jgi:hypothetical protein